MPDRKVHPRLNLDRPQSRLAAAPAWHCVERIKFGKFRSIRWSDTPPVPRHATVTPSWLWLAVPVADRGATWRTCGPDGKRRGTALPEGLRGAVAALPEALQRDEPAIHCHTMLPPQASA